MATTLESILPQLVSQGVQLALQTVQPRLELLELRFDVIDSKLDALGSTVAEVRQPDLVQLYDSCDWHNVERRGDVVHDFGETGIEGDVPPSNFEPGKKKNKEKRKNLANDSKVARPEAKAATSPGLTKELDVSSSIQAVKNEATSPGSKQLDVASYNIQAVQNEVARTSPGSKQLDVASSDIQAVKNEVTRTSPGLMKQLDVSSNIQAVKNEATKTPPGLMKQHSVVPGAACPNQPATRASARPDASNASFSSCFLLLLHPAVKCSGMQPQPHSGRQRDLSQN